MDVQARHPRILIFGFTRFLRKKTCVKIINNYGIEETVDRRKRWEQVLRMGKKITPSMCVCSLHFKSDDYCIPPGDQAGKRYLKVTAVPSCNLPKSSIETKSAKNLKSEFKRKERNLVHENSISQDSNNFNEQKNENGILYLEESKGTVPTNIVTDEFVTNMTNTPEKRIENIVKPLLVDIGVQVTSGDLIDLNFSSFITTDKELSTATGIPTLKMLDTFIKIVERVAPKCAFYSGKLTIRDRIILTFIRLKQNVTYSFLNILFKNCSERHISNVICNTLDILSNALKFAIVLPTKNEILRNVPFCFQEYSDVSLILDCTEIEIQKPNTLCCQLITYSFYKGRNTIKFLTACTPGGLLAYVSPAYGGRCSDKAIFEQSGILDYLEKDEKLMVDKGFLIDDTCIQNGIQIIRPPFLRNKSQFLQKEALNTASIAKARVHVERLNQRLKVFQILGSKMPSCLVKKADQIMVVLAAVVNLSSPILSDEKFPS